MYNMMIILTLLSTAHGYDISSNRQLHWRDYQNSKRTIKRYHVYKNVSLSSMKRFYALATKRYNVPYDVIGEAHSMSVESAIHFMIHNEEK